MLEDFSPKEQTENTSIWTVGTISGSFLDKFCREKMAQAFEMSQVKLEKKIISGQVNKEKSSWRDFYLNFTKRSFNKVCN